MSAILGTYTRRKVSFKKGKGVYLYAHNGNKYLDFVSGIAVNSLGHCHTHMVQTIQRQSKKLIHVSNAFEIPEQEKLARRLTNNSFADYVVFVNSGAEATEAAIKIARRYFFSIGKSYKNRILCIKNSFHGRTIAAIHASGSKKMIEGFGPKVPGFDHIEFRNSIPRFLNLRKKIKKNTAAIMVETVLGEGGIKCIPNKCLRYLRKICDEKKILLILDEVQCGIGRSGKLFAFQYANVKPDIVPIAKGIGGGFPIGACLVNKKASIGMTPGTHGSTFGGNPLAMSVGNSVLDVILKKGFLQKVEKNGKFFKDELVKLKDKHSNKVLEVRGKGLMIGIKLSVDNIKFLNHMFKNKLLGVKAADNVVRLLPPLIIKKNEIKEAIKILDKTLGDFQ